MGRLEQLPDALLHIIVASLDLRSLCALDSTCHTLHTCVSPILPQLDTLHLADTPLSAKHLEKYLSTNTKIHTLTLDCRKLEKKGIKLLLKAHLQKLQLIHCFGISSSTHFLYEIGKHCTNLRSLSLDLFWIEDQRLLELYIENLQQMLKSLHYLEFWLCQYLSMHGQGREFDAQVFGMLPKFLGPSVKALRIMHMEERDARQLSNVKWNGEAGLMPRVRVVGCQNLQKLSLVLSIITDTLMSILTGNLTCLKELDLEDDPWEVPPAELDLSNWGVQQVANCRNLKRLSLVRGQSLVWGRGQSLSFRRVNDLGFLLMAQSCKNLESIRLGRFSQVTDTGLNSLLENCSHLHTFELIHMNQTSDLTFHDMSATACSLVAVSLPAANQITSDAVAQLACCKHLKFLNLAFCRSVGDRGLRAVSSLSKLAILDLSGADITDFGLFSLSKGSTPLVSLSLRSCKRLTHTGISALTQGCLPATLEALDLSNLPAVMDHTVVALISSGMQIVDLRLRDCHSLTEACVAALASMEYKGNCLGGSLRVLDLSNNGVTASSLEWFRRPYFPRLRWLGLGRHLATELLARLRGERSSLDIAPAGCDLDFGYDGLSAKHGKHWNGSCKEQGGFGTLFDDRDCELCSLSA